MRIGVVGNGRYRALDGVLQQLVEYAVPRGHTLLSEDEIRVRWPTEVAPLPVDGADIDLLVSFGGDGTLLRAVRTLGTREIPVLPINLGHIGFLTSTKADALPSALDAFEQGTHRIERRQTLRGTILDADGSPRAAEQVVNDVVVHKAGAVRVIRLHMEIDGEEVGFYTADGMIVATPAGSTAYSLSAGGPVLVPGVDSVVVTAICPHTMRVRPIVVPASSTITLAVGGRKDEGAAVSFDGQLRHTITRPDRVVIERGEFAVLLVRVGTDGFFTRMRQKLEWGDLSDRELAFRAD
jgi:NAD+ kinase